MTKEQTIEKLKALYINAVAAMLRADACGDDESSKVMTEYAETLNAAINALETALQTDGDCISRQATIDALVNKLDSIDHVPQWVFDELTGVISALPSAQPETTARKFEGIVVEYPHPDLCTYPEYKGKPYFSIKYTENGECFVGFGTYKPEVLSDYLKTYFFISSVQPEPCDAISRADAIRVASGYCHPANVAKELAKLPSVQPEPKWIPCSERLPEAEEKHYWVCTDTGYQCQCRWTNINHIWTELTTEWHWHIMDTPQYSKVIAWMPLPEPYQEEGD